MSKEHCFLTHPVTSIRWCVADKMSLQISVGALRVAVVGAELEVGCEEGAGVVASASEKQEGFSFLP